MLAFTVSARPNVCVSVGGGGGCKGLTKGSINHNLPAATVLVAASAFLPQPVVVLALAFLVYNYIVCIVCVTYHTGMFCV